MDDVTLVRQAQSGGRDAFDMLVDRYYRMVYGISYRMTGNSADADELAHDAFVEAYLKLVQLKDPARFCGWLKTLTLNVCRMWQREKRRHNMSSLDENIAAPQDDANEKYARMYSGMSHLSASHRMVLALHYFEDLSYSEIARFLGIPNGTVMSRISRARHLLKEELEEMKEDIDIAEVPDIRFKEAIQAEVSLLLSIEGCKPFVGTRLRAVFEKSPDRLIKLLAESDDTVLANIAVILPRLAACSMHSILSASDSHVDDVPEHAKAVLKMYISRCTPETVPGAEPDMAAIDAYILLDQLYQANVSNLAKAKILLFCADSCKDHSTRALLVSALACCSEDAFQLLMEQFTSNAGSARWVRHALARFGNRFLSEVYRLLDDGETRLGLIGFETIAKSMKHQWIEDASPERFANELRVSDKYSPVRKEDLDADLLSQATKRVAGLIHHADADIRNSAIGVLGDLGAWEYISVIRGCMRHEDTSTRLSAIHVLAGMGDLSIVEELMEKAQSDVPEEAVAAVEALGQMGVCESVTILQSLTCDKEISLRTAAINALGGIDSPSADAALKDLLTYKDAVVRKSAAKALYGGVKCKTVKQSEVDRKLAEKRRRKSQPIAFVSLDAAIRYAFTELRRYEERELTERIACICEDYCATRRYLIERKLMTRANGVYTFTTLGETVWKVEHLIMKGEHA